MPLRTSFRNLFRRRPLRQTVRRAPAPRLEQLEDRLAPAQLLFVADADRSLLLDVANGQVRIVDAQAPQIVLVSQSLSDTTTALIRANGHDINLTIAANVPSLPGGIDFQGGAGNTTLIGPDEDVTWHV